jgi:CHAT domain-containing protein
VSRLERAVEGEHDDEAAASLAVGFLAQDDVESAIDRLQQLSRDTAPDATILSDLAAAYLARVPSKERATDAVAALDAAARAVAISPRLSEARFNLALALEAVHLFELADEAWRAYEDVDASSPWTTEARLHRSRLGRMLAERWETQQAMLEDGRVVVGAAAPLLDELLRTNPQVIREYVDDRLLPEWARQKDARGSGEALQRAETLAASVQRVQGDSLTADALAAIRAKPLCVPTLLRAHQRFAVGRSLYLAARYEEAEGPLRESEVGFRRCASPFAVWAMQHQAVAEYFRGRTDRSLHLLAAVEREARRHDYLNVLGRAKWMRAIILTARSQAVPALREYRQAEAIFHRANESEGMLGASAGNAEVLRDLGEIEESWWSRLSALNETRRVRPARRHTAYWLAATGAEEQGYYYAADWILEQTLRSAIASDRPSLIAETHMRRMMVRGHLRRRDLAESDLAAASTWAQRIADAAVRARTHAEIAALEASLWQTIYDDRASRAIQRALAFFSGPDWARRRPGLLLTSGRIHAAARRWPLAIDDFEAGISQFEATRRSMPAGGFKDAFADEGANLFDELVWTQWVGAGRRDLALASAEKGRAAVLAQEMDVSRTEDPQRLSKALPPGITVIYFDVLVDRLAIWVVRSSGIQSFERLIDRQVLEQSVDRLVSLLERDDSHDVSAVRQASARLHDILLGPVTGLVPNTTLVFVPHGVLHKVPFGALFDARRRQYLIESYIIGSAPSLAVLRHVNRQFNHLAAMTPRSALVFGNPSVGLAERQSLPDLPESAREAQQIAALYPSNHLLEARAATRSAFLSAAPEHDVVHVAAHAIANPRRPELSRLLLAPDPGREFGALYPSDVASMSFVRTRVVVMAACRTGGGRTSASEGLLSMARPFLARGVPTVIATLWDIDDNTSRTLFVAFHGALRSGRTPGEALREAQLSLLHGHDPAMQSPARWGTVALLGTPGGWAPTDGETRGPVR